MKVKFLIILALSTSIPSQASTVNDERLLKSLIERGVICPNLTEQENREALRLYLSNKNKASKNKSENVNDGKKSPQECISHISK